MVATITINPYGTSNAAGSFNVSSTGFIQGEAMDQPAIRNSLFGGVLSGTETLPMFGGVAIADAIPTPGSLTLPSSVLGTVVTRATQIAAGAAGTMTGFSVFDQNFSAINSPQSPVPLVGSYGQVNFYRFGSGARIAVACDPSLASLEGGSVLQNVSWDFNDSVLQPYDASTATYSLTSITSAYANGVYTFTVVGAVASPVAGVGDIINVGGVTSTGSSLVNGTHVVTAFTDSQHYQFQVQAASGAIATGALAGTLVLNYGVGKLPCTILDISVGNCMTVNYNPATGFATWNRSGSCALIQI